MFDEPKDEHLMRLPVPYDLPPIQYGSEDRPWSWDRHYSKPDVYGLTCQDQLNFIPKQGLPTEVKPSTTDSVSKRHMKKVKVLQTFQSSFVVLHPCPSCSTCYQDLLDNAFGHFMDEKSKLGSGLFEYCR